MMQLCIMGYMYWASGHPGTGLDYATPKVVLDFVSGVRFS